MEDLLNRYKNIQFETLRQKGFSKDMLVDGETNRGGGGMHQRSNTSQKLFNNSHI